MKIFVAKLPPEYDETAIATLFITYGDISTINLVMDRETGRSKGYAFIEMPNDEEALNAISHLDQKTVGHNRQLSVSQAQERPRTAGGGFDRRNDRQGGFQRNGNGGGFKRNTNNNNYNKDRGPRSSSGYDRNAKGRNGDM
jgi:cold-inducible RNA-binding protein